MLALLKCIVNHQNSRICENVYFWKYKVYLWNFAEYTRVFPLRICTIGFQCPLVFKEKPPNHQKAIWDPIKEGSKTAGTSPKSNHAWFTKFYIFIAKKRIEIWNTRRFELVSTFQNNWIRNLEYILRELYCWIRKIFLAPRFRK